MPRPWPLLAPCVTLLAIGCARPVTPALQPGDVVRPEVAFAPRGPWPAGSKVTMGVLVRVERPGGEARYLRDDEVGADEEVIVGRVTFLDGERPLGEPFEVPFARDC